MHLLDTYIDELVWSNVGKYNIRNLVHDIKPLY